MRLFGLGLPRASRPGGPKGSIGIRGRALFGLFFSRFKATGFHNIPKDGNQPKARENKQHPSEWARRMRRTPSKPFVEEYWINPKKGRKNKGNKDSRCFSFHLLPF